MPIPVNFLIGSPRRLAIAITLFVVLDLSVLLINLWIAEQVASDAVAINLAGRQRMLSQQITKTLLLINFAPDDGARQVAHTELTHAFQIFATTLRAFDQGGVTTGGDGNPAVLGRVEPGAGRKPLEAALHLIAPVAARLDSVFESATANHDELLWAMNYMVANNHAILANMNLLTTALEQHSVKRIRTLRTVQTGAFLLAMINFLVIVLGLVKQYHHVANDGHRWRELAQRDCLTGLYNRAALREALDSTLESVTRQGQTLAVLILDLDGFKPINDSRGHAAGDQLLRQLAETLLQLARESDTVARLGGDEFALICPNLHGSLAIGNLCDRIVHGIADMACGPEHGCGVRASVGVAVYPIHGTSTEALLVAADRAMYQSKRAGGNRWTEAELNR